MRLWRLTRARYAALDGEGPRKWGARWTSPGRPVVNFASEPGLAVLVVLRYLPRDLAGIDQDYQLGWVETDKVPERLPFVDDLTQKRQVGDAWLESQRTLLAAVRSAVLPEADIIMLNPEHPDANALPPMQWRPFDFVHCLSLPPDG